MTSFEGRCLCRGIRFTVGPPTLFVAHCHCRWCREAHGAAFVTWVGVAERRFRLEQGADLLRWYASTEQSRRGFCGRCGTTLFFATVLAPGEIHVTRASIPGELDRAPQLHCFYDQHVGWGEPGDDLPRFDSDAGSLSKYRVVRPRE
jgi:hypothetical protein